MLSPGLKDFAIYLIGRPDRHTCLQAATEAALGLPPLQRDAGLLRMCHVLAELCNLACKFSARHAMFNMDQTMAVETKAGMASMFRAACLLAQCLRLREGKLAAINMNALHAYT